MTDSDKEIGALGCVLYLAILALLSLLYHAAIATR